ncbi:MAG: Hsp20/alpha crystallin family protein [candidate division Zixibacteria bacterium]|nr:Hsp20/alpha crystallin family protein [candidate division Zixibacteria bacterium]
MNCVTNKHYRNPMNREIDRLFSDMFSFPTYRQENSGDFAPRVDIQESDDNLALTFELPGMEKGDINVTIAEGVLTVAGKREIKNESKDNNYVRREIRRGSFNRAFTLPDTIDPESVVADYKNGLLEVKLAKREEVKPKQIEVKIS